MKIALFIMLATANGAAAQVLDGAAFDAFSRGTTLYFQEHGQFYGAEQYFSDHRTVWRSNDGRCVNGKWSVVKQDICFAYDNGDGPYCWRMEQTESGLTATSRNDPAKTPPVVLELSGQDHVPILCTGPLFGV